MFDRPIIDDLDERLEVARRVLRMEDPAAFFSDASNRDKFNVNLLFGYVRAFVRLAYLGDIKLAASDLHTTRQTVARHIQELENLLECELFETVGSPSRLTAKGSLWLPRAQEVFELSSAFQTRRGSNPAEYRSTQLPLRMLLRDEDASPILKGFAEAWMLGDKTLQCESLREFRPHWIVYERQGGSWASREIGDRSSFARWFGPKLTRESEGRTVPDMCSGADLRDEVSFLLDGIYTRGGLHFSEVACKLRRPGREGREPVLYQRVLVELFDEQAVKPVVGSVISVLQHHQTNL